MSGDLYLQGILTREAVDTGPFSPVRSVQATLSPLLTAWGNRYLRSVAPSGSFAKGTANKSGTDIDLFLSLIPETQETLKDIHDSLAKKLRDAGYQVRPQNVSLNITVGGYSVDLVPGKQQNAFLTDHSLYRRKSGSWLKTNVTTHIQHVAGSGRQNEIRAIKLWRRQKGIDFPSFYLELAVIEALKSGAPGGIADRVWKVFSYLADSFSAARFIDPANTNNVISDDLTAAEKLRIKNAAAQALIANTWNQIII